jgi:hypothetical protein
MLVRQFKISLQTTAFFPAHWFQKKKGFCVKKRKNMANQTSVRSAYANLVTALAQSFPNNCAHLKKLPKTQNIVTDWQVLLNNARVGDRDVALFHQPPLSALGLSRLHKEGKLTAKSTAHVWEYVDRVLEALQPPVEVPSPQQLMQLVGAQGRDPNFQDLASSLFGDLQANSDLAQLLSSIPEGKEDPSGNPAGIADMFAKLGGNPAGIADVFAKLAGNPAFASIMLTLKQQLSTNPELERLANQLRTGGPESILKLAKTFKDRMEAAGEAAAAGEGADQSVASILKGVLGGEGVNEHISPNLEHNLKNIMDQLPEHFKTKLGAFGAQVSEQEGNSFANVLGLLGSHFDQDDLTNVAEVLVPNITQLIPADARAA